MTVLFDEIDDLLAQRQDKTPTSFLKIVVAAMLNRLQDLRDACPRQEVCLILATNYVERIERALIRQGRIDMAVPVVYPDRESRRAMVSRHARRLLRKSPGWAKFLKEELCESIVQRTDYWPWLVIERLCTDLVEKLDQLPPGSRGARADAKRAKGELTRLVDELRPKASKSPYDQDRLTCLGKSPELLDEFLHYLAAGADKIREYRKQLEGISLPDDPGRLREEGERLWNRERA